MSREPSQPPFLRELLGTPPIVARVISCVFWLRSNLSKLRLQGGKESPVCPSCKMRRDSGELLAFPNPTGTLLSEAHFYSPQLSCVKDFVAHVKWPRQWGISCIPESHWHAAFRSSFLQPPTIVCQGFCPSCKMAKTVGNFLRSRIPLARCFQKLIFTAPNYRVSRILSLM